MLGLERFCLYSAYRLSEARNKSPVPVKMDMKLKFAFNVAYNRNE